MKQHIAIIGAGPAGLIAAQHLSAAGHAVTIYERMPSPARKLLMAGRGGLNLTHSEEMATFVSRYGAAARHLAPMLHAFTPGDLIAWANALGQETFIGSSGRVFPKAMKASPLLRAWLRRLEQQGVRMRTRMHWQGWDEDGALRFINADGRTESVHAEATLLALGGASWPKLGGDGGWREILAARGVAVAPFKPANMGFEIAWSEHFRGRFAGAPLKGVALRFGALEARGHAMITAYGIEGGAIYALSAPLREALSDEAPQALAIDLRPDRDAANIAAKLERAKSGESASSSLRKLGLDPVAITLLREAGPLPRDPAALAALIKAFPLKLEAARGLDRAISTAGGVRWDAVDERLQLKALPGVFVAGEMLDWEAPTGGYLLQACFASGAWVARGMGELCRFSKKPTLLEVRKWIPLTC